MMSTSWCLHVVNFAKIREARIKLAPLMCFVGDNNTGKSYMMSLLWGLLAMGIDIFSPDNQSESPQYKKCKIWLKTHIGGNIELDAAAEQMYVDWFNERLAAKKTQLIRGIFHSDVTLDKIEISEYQRQRKYHVRWRKNVSYRASVSEQGIVFPIRDAYTDDDYWEMNYFLCWNLLMQDMAAPFNVQGLHGERNGKPIYMPASRTGFMLVYRQIVDSALQVAFSNLRKSSPQGTLTSPYLDFLQLLVHFSQEHTGTDLQSLAEFLKQDMVNGDLLLTNDAVPSIRYQPNGLKQPVPLHITSSVVTELAPLLLLMESDVEFNTVIIEEPEAHLHPALQKKMAQFIIRLMHRGKQVWITTHSDTILQHLNNMIKLKNSPRCQKVAKKFSYEEFDLLVASEVGMYQFQHSADQKTDIQRLEASKNGFVVPTFNDTISSLLDEIYTIQGDD